MWDKPNERSSHQTPVLRGGGLAIVLVLAIIILVCVRLENAKLAYMWLTALATLGWINFLDDYGHVRKRFRLVAQIFSAIIVLAIFGFSPLFIFLIGFLLVAFTNFVNFIDGINGLVTGQLLLIVAGIVLLTEAHSNSAETAQILFALVFAGALAGFLPFNFPKAKLFLGDVGSVLLGFSCGILVIWMGRKNTELYHVFIPLCGYFFLEGGITLLRRIIAGKRWEQAHRDHFYQRLIRIKWSHQQTSLLIWKVQVLITLILWYGIKTQVDYLWFWIVPTVIWGILFSAIEIKFRKYQAETD